MNISHTQIWTWIYKGPTSYTKLIKLELLRVLARNGNAGIRSAQQGKPRGSVRRGGGGGGGMKVRGENRKKRQGRTKQCSQWDKERTRRAQTTQVKVVGDQDGDQCWTAVWGQRQPDKPPDYRLSGMLSLDLSSIWWEKFLPVLSLSEFHDKSLRRSLFTPRVVNDFLAKQWFSS